MLNWNRIVYPFMKITSSVVPAVTLIQHIGINHLPRKCLFFEKWCITHKAATLNIRLAITKACYLKRCTINCKALTKTSWWRHQMETFSALLAGNSPVTGDFPSRRPLTRGFNVFFDLHLNKRLSKQSIRRWFEAPSRSLWRHYNVATISQPTNSLI